MTLHTPKRAVRLGLYPLRHICLFFMLLFSRLHTRKEAYMLAGIPFFCYYARTYAPCLGLITLKRGNYVLFLIIGLAFIP